MRTGSITQGRRSDNLNKEGYRTPTKDKAIGNETRREKLRKKYRIREGDIIKMKIEIRTDKAKEETVTKKVRARIKEIHTHLITVEYPWGGIESFTWWDFERRRI